MESVKSRIIAAFCVICVICGRYSTGFPVAEVEVEGADTASWVAGGEAVVQLEVGAAGLDGHGGVGIVQRVGGSEEEDAAVFSRDADGAVAARVGKSV